jgi:hypothetical protein
MTWPVNWIEQAAYYKQLQAKVAQLQAQARPVTVASFREPTQAQWENAYVAQTRQVPPIFPGVRLYWMDVRNGRPKRYTTVWQPDNVLVDPLVRPLLGEDIPRGCLRFLGSRQMQDLSIFQPVLSPLRKPERGIFIDLETIIKKNLLAVIIHYRMLSPILLNLHEFNNSDTTYWGDTTRAFGITLERGAGGATSSVSDYRVPGGAKLPQNTTYYAVSQFTDTTGAGSETVNIAEYNHGWLAIMGLGPDFAADQQAFSTSTNWIGMSGAVSSGSPTHHTWLTYGMKYDGVGARSLVMGRSITPNPFFDEHAYLYGLFASDPGPLELFNV